MMIKFIDSSLIIVLLYTVVHAHSHCHNRKFVTKLHTNMLIDGLTG